VPGASDPPHSLPRVAAVLALLSSVLWGGADFVGGTVSRRRAAVVVVGTSQLVGLVAALVVAVAAGATDAPLDYLPWAIGAGLAGLVGLVAYYSALATGTMGIVAPIAALGVVVPVLVGLGRGERPATVQLVGIALGILGIVLASGPELSGRATPRPLLLAGVAAVGFGLALLFIAEGSSTSTLMTMVAMRVTSVAVTAAAVAVRGRSDARALTRSDLGVISLVGLADVGANLTFGLASTRADWSIVSVLGSLYPVATVLLARFVQAERLTRVQVVGVTVAMLGVLCIASRQP
jgi:drug/metabolite transporter (DMT)-like permease